MAYDQQRYKYLSLDVLYAMTRSSVILLLFAFASVSGCEPSGPTTSVTISLSGLENEKLEAFNMVEDIYYELSGARDSFNITLHKEMILDLKVGFQHSYIHVQPGDQLTVDTLSSYPLTFGVIESPSKENQYLVDFNAKAQEAMDNFVLSDVTKLPPDRFLLSTDSMYADLIKLITEINNDTAVSDVFKSAMEKRYTAITVNGLSFYPSLYKRHNGKEPILPDNFFSQFEESDKTDLDYLLFVEGRDAVSFYHSKDLDYLDFDSVNDFFEASLQTAKEQYGNSKVTKYCNLITLINMISRGGLDEVQELITDYRGFAKEGYFNEKLDEAIRPWAALISGKPAPDFKAVTRHGAHVQLSELKGKKVYVDVWATWCGPCIAEIPFLKKLETELHDENIKFVSVSIDEVKDAEKWKNFITNKNLTGLQLMAEGDWTSDIATAFNIKAIPRFLLIDEAGNIISANALRPSDKNVKDLLLN